MVLKSRYDVKFCDLIEYFEKIYVEEFEDINFISDDIVKYEWDYIKLLNKRKWGELLNKTYFNIDIFTYINYILASYEYKEDNIWAQFRIDFIRIPVFINGKQCPIQNFNRSTIKFSKYFITNGDITTNFQTFIAMMTNQSSFCLPFMILYKLHINDDDNTLCCANDNRNVHIILDHNIKIIICANYFVKNIYTEQITKTIKTRLEISFTKNKNQINCSSCILQLKY